MPVYKDNKTNSWYIRTYVTDVRGITKQVTKRNKDWIGRDGKQKAIEEELKLRLRGQIESNVTIYEVFINYIDFISLKLKERTVVVTKNRIEKHIISYFGKKKTFNSLTLKDVINWKMWFNNKTTNFGTPYSTSFKQTIFVNFSSLTKYATIYYGLEKNVVSIVGNFAAPEEFKKEMKIITYKNFIDKFIPVVDNQMWKVFFTVLMFCGLRCGEAQAITWKDVDLTNKKININKTLTTKLKGKVYSISTPKTKGSNRIIDVADTVYNNLLELKEYYKQFKDYDENWFVFNGPNPLAETTIRRNKNKYFKKAGLEQIRIHDFRHSFASMMMNFGVDITIISKILGHDRISTTQDIYSHLYPNAQKNAINTINEIINKTKTRPK